MIPLKPGSVVKVFMKEGIQKHFQFLGYGSDFRRLVQTSVVNLNYDGRVLIGLPLGKVNKLIINGQVVPERIPLENIADVEVIDESQNKIFEDVL